MGLIICSLKECKTRTSSPTSLVLCKAKVVNVLQKYLLYHFEEVLKFLSGGKDRSGDITRLWLGEFETSVRNSWA